MLRDTPLHIAVRSRNFRVAEQLVARGANPSLRNAYDYSVFDMVAAMLDDGAQIPAEFLAELGEEPTSDYSDNDDGSDDEGSDDEGSDGESDASSHDDAAGAVNCPGQHGLKLVTASQRRARDLAIACNLCRSKIGATEESRECRRCDFDVCLSCYEVA